MNLIKVILLCIMLCFAFSSVRAGDEPAAADQKPDKEALKKEKVIKLISLTKIAELYVETIVDAVKQTPFPSEDKELFIKYATVESLTAKFVPIYMDVYTDEELDGMITFYSSPVGQSMVEKTPETVGRLREVNLEWEREASVKVKEEKDRKAAAEKKE